MSEVYGSRTLRVDFTNVKDSWENFFSEPAREYIKTELMLVFDGHMMGEMTYDSIEGEGERLGQALKPAERLRADDFILRAMLARMDKGR